MMLGLEVGSLLCGGWVDVGSTDTKRRVATLRDVWKIG
jgi:hypothetical protein